MEQIHKPIICAVNGICCGGGLHFICDTDIIIGSDERPVLRLARERRAGLGMGTYRPQPPIPLNYVLRMTLQGKAYRIDAEEAHRHRPR